MKRWPTKRLGEVADVFNGKTPAKTEQRTAGHPVLKIKDVDESGNFRGNFESFVDSAFAQTHAKKKLNAADVLILNAAHNADYVASKVFYADEQVSGAVATGEWTIIRANSSFLLPGFVNHWIRSQSGRTSIKNLVRGIHLYPSDVASVRLAVPPLAEQERIVKLLDEADELRKLRARADRRTSALIPALFHEMFGDPAINENSWELVEFMQVVSKEKYSIQRGPFGGAIKKEIFVADGFKIYEQKNAIRDDFEVGTYFIDAAKFKEMENFSVVPDDLIVSCSGTIGRVAIVPKGAKPGIINQALLKVRLDKTKALPIFLKHLLETDHLQWLIFGGSAGSAIKNVKPLIQIKKTVFPLPPLSLQKEFAMRVAEIRALETEEAASRRRLDALFQSLLHLAFQGDL